MASLLIIVIVIVILAWRSSIQVGILAAIILTSAEIYGIRQLFVPKRIKSVVVKSNEIVIEYRKTSVKVPFEDIKKLEHYKRGPLTERIWVYANIYKYEIPFDLKDFHNMCKCIYVELTKINMEHVADEWFQKNFGKEESVKENF